MNRIGPLGAKDTSQRQVHQKIPKLRWIQDVRVVKRNECGHSSDTQLLIIGREFRKGSLALGVDLPFVGQRALERNAPMRLFAFFANK